MNAAPTRLEVLRRTLLAQLVAMYETEAGVPPGDDERAMVTGQRSAADLLAWCDDMEARLGWDVADFREALEAFIRQREGERAAAILQPLAALTGWGFDYADPRGLNYGGAKISAPAVEGANACADRTVHLVVSEDPPQWVAELYVNDGEMDEYTRGVVLGEALGDSDELDADAARAAVLAMMGEG